MERRAHNTLDHRAGRRLASGPNSLHSVRKRHIEQALDLSEGNIEKAAALLEVTLSELRRLISVLDIQSASRDRKSDTASGQEAHTGERGKDRSGRKTRRGS